MKKLLFSVVAVGILAGSSFAADNQIIINATVPEIAVVGFDTSTGGQTSFENFIGSNIDITYNQGVLDPVTKPIFVKSNNPDGVTITLTDSSNGGHLKHAHSYETILMSYTLLGTAYALGDSVALTNGVSVGDTTVGDLVITPSQIPTTQLAGNYSTTLTVTVSTP